MIGIVGAGAFGTALAVTLARAGQGVDLWARDPDHVAAMAKTRANHRYLPQTSLPDLVQVTADIGALSDAEVVLLVVPMQTLADVLAVHHVALDGRDLVACCKGLDLKSRRGPIAIMAEHCPRSRLALLTGPSFAADVAQGLPTALTLAGGSIALQHLLSTPSLRLYRTDDVIGAELGGALKNVIAIAAGVVIGAGLGASARAALMTRGFAEMVRLATAMGARADTLFGLSGLGDLVLTATSTQSRNFSFGVALGRGEDFDPGITVEGAATALAMAELARLRGIDMPITMMVAAVIEQNISLSAAIETLFSRPLKEE